MHHPVIHHLPSLFLPILTMVVLLAACSPLTSLPTLIPTGIAPASVEPTQASTSDVSYQTFALPAPEPVSFELPAGWDFWGNGGGLSPDDGRTLAGLRLVWVESDQEAGHRLFNEDSVLLDQTNLTVANVEMQRYTVEVYRTLAATGERSVQGYELVYALSGPSPDQIAGVFVSAPTREELSALAPTAEHMAASLMWGD